jgi:hypothetical protein
MSVIPACTAEQNIPLPYFYPHHMLDTFPTHPLLANMGRNIYLLHSPLPPYTVFIISNAYSSVGFSTNI